jgi:hypothetical protein
METMMPATASVLKFLLFKHIFLLSYYDISYDIS